MNLPDYFLVDLPPEAELTAALITEACQTLKRNRQRYLEGRSTEGIVGILDSVARDWLSEDSPFRKMAMEAGPAGTGFSRAVLAAGLDQFFQQLTAANLEVLLRQELGHPRRLDNFFAHEGGGSQRAALALGPPLLAHVAPGNIPNPVLMEMVLGLLVRSAQFVKCASGQTLLPRLFAHSLYEADHKLGACLEVAAWKGGLDALDAALFAEADGVVAMGSDETVAAIRAKVPATARFLGYGARLSFGYVTREALDEEAEGVAKRAAADVSAWDQLGCLSPHVIYVEEGASRSVDAFAVLLAGELAALEKTHPRGPLGVEEAAAIARRRSFYEVRAAHSLETKLWTSIESTAWTVILEKDPNFQVSCLNRFIYIKSVPDLTQALNGLEPVREKLSTVGLAADAARAPELARTFARWGVKRICPLGRMQNPPLGWRHDGRPPLGDLVTWSDWEK